MPPSQPILEINPAHALVKRVEAVDGDEALVADYAALIFEQAMLAEGGTLDDPASFIARMNRLLVGLRRAPRLARRRPAAYAIPPPHAGAGIPSHACFSPSLCASFAQRHSAPAASPPSRSMRGPILFADRDRAQVSEPDWNLRMHRIPEV